MKFVLPNCHRKHMIGSQRPNRAGLTCGHAAVSPPATQIRSSNLKSR